MGSFSLGKECSSCSAGTAPEATSAFDLRAEEGIADLNIQKRKELFSLPVPDAEIAKRLRHHRQGKLPSCFLPVSGAYCQGSSIEAVSLPPSTASRYSGFLLLGKTQAHPNRRLLFIQDAGPTAFPKIFLKKLERVSFLHDAVEICVKIRDTFARHLRRFKGHATHPVHPEPY